MSTYGRTNLGKNLYEKRTQWCGNGSKVAHLGAKMPFLGHKRLQTPQMTGKSGSNGGSQWDTCWGSTLSAKLVRKMHPVVWKWPQNCPFGAKKSPHMCSTVIHHLFHFYQPWGVSKAAYGQKWLFWLKLAIFGHFHAIRCTFLTSFASRLVPPHVFRCDLIHFYQPFGGSWAPNDLNCRFGPKLTIFGPFLRRN